ncbi:MAG: riboflavin synthase [Bacteroidetes bacterium]|jgi:riboflavin synthase|nr:riboflavin synthase [Bacteroidota bacterium]
MFSGIIEAMGTVKSLSAHGTNLTLILESTLGPSLHIDQSLAHNGVCLTVEEVHGLEHRVTAIEETLIKTNLRSLEVGNTVNLERCLTLGSLLDGHLVQGHIDTVGRVEGIEDRQGSHLITIAYPTQFAHLLIEKGSITVNGISLTAFGVDNGHFKVAIVPYTWQHTNLPELSKGAGVNLEFDVIGKYVARLQGLGHGLVQPWVL